MKRPFSVMNGEKYEVDCPRKVKGGSGSLPWLTLKVVDKNSEFLYIPADRVMGEASRLGAVPLGDDPARQG
jgi:hypothetical protein